ncbi:MAG: cbb3-type cytochrome oxidase assembly protein CcoS [Rhodospirillaceae bacterium]|nr:cbb3-type cytochrome oxidase assembly protein CcoS [Rhodospirillaceae bacterium]MBL6930195.1 cbb3-type cytochrome oxidase assembly protein CcoS [Rhodospirillales bacterium]MBL6942117.1 cbb3-type cytochrome oxidase assembly protein CcoS [Rhodospirillales bacterium]
MDILLYLIPIALLLGIAALIAFLWSLKSGQYEDMEGAANRILFDDDDSPKQGETDKD